MLNSIFIKTPLKSYISITATTVLLALAIAVQAQQDTTSVKDSTIAFAIKSWTVDEFSGLQNYQNIDTSLFSFEIYEPQNKYGFMPSHLGEMASPSFFFFLDNKSIYSENPYISSTTYNFLHGSNSLFFNTSMPYTNLHYSQSTGKEQNINLFHTQNINKDLNISFHINHFGSNGYYLRQGVKGRRYGVTLSYLGGKYSAYASVNINKLTSEENHGFDLNYDLAEYKNVLVSLYEVANSNASSEIKAKNIWLKQEWNLLRAANSIDSMYSEQPNYLMSIGNNLLFEKTERDYIDKKINLQLYKKANYDTIATDDHLALYQINDNMYFKLYKHFGANVSINAQGFIGVEYQNFHDSRYFDTVLYETTFLNQFAGASGMLKIKQSQLKGSIKTYVGGYKSGTSSLKTQFDNKYTIGNNTFTLTLNASFTSFSPNFYYESLSLNHFNWNYNFENINETDYSASFTEKNHGIECNVHGKIVSNALVFTKNDSLQISTIDTDSKLSFNVHKKTTLFNFSLINDLFFNMSDNFLKYSIPAFVSRNSLLYTIHIPKKKTELQIGVDTWYNSPYYLPEYIPEIGQFVPSENKKTMQNILCDAFFNVSIQTVRVFIKYSHFSYYLTDAEYYSAYNYLYKQPRITFGFSWRFIH